MADNLIHQCWWCKRVKGRRGKGAHPPDWIGGETSWVCPTCRKAFERIKQERGIRAAIDEMYRRRKGS